MNSTFVMGSLTAFSVLSLLASIGVLAMTRASPASMPTVRDDEEINGRKAWVIDNGRMRVALMRAGGHIGEVRLLTDDPKLGINPMFMPTGSGYMGHLVCFPTFGPASAEERQQGLRGHGEAGVVEWQQTKPPRIDATGVTFYYGAELTKTHYRIERAVTLRTGEAIVRVEEWVENLAPYDRPYNWDQHATFGAPFAAPEKNVLDVSGRKAMSDPQRTGKGQWQTSREFDWPQAPRADGSTISLREFRAVPDGQVYTPILTDARDNGPAWFTLYNVEYPLLVGYVFSAADHPWIIDWQNQPRTDSPAGVARGIEFGTSPWDEGLRHSVERATMFGAPTYRWIAGGQRLSSAFTIFLAEIPHDFRGVETVRIVSAPADQQGGDDIEIVERYRGTTLRTAGTVRK